MIRRILRIGRWVVVFLFAHDGYDDEAVLAALYDIDAPLPVMQRAGRIMESRAYNRGFTFANPAIRRAVVVVGPTTSGKQFVNTTVHEICHLGVAIAKNQGKELDGEATAYLMGDIVQQVANEVCVFGCPSEELPSISCRFSSVFDRE